MRNRRNVTVDSRQRKSVIVMNALLTFHIHYFSESNANVIDCNTAFRNSRKVVTASGNKQYHMYFLIVGRKSGCLLKNLLMPALNTAVNISFNPRWPQPKRY